MACYAVNPLQFRESTDRRAEPERSHAEAQRARRRKSWFSPRPLRLCVNLLKKIERMAATRLRNHEKHKSYENFRVFSRLSWLGHRKKVNGVGWHPWERGRSPWGGRTLNKARFVWMSNGCRFISLTALLYVFFIEPFGEPGVVHRSAKSAGTRFQGTLTPGPLPVGEGVRRGVWNWHLNCSGCGTVCFRRRRARKRHGHRTWC